MGRAKQSEGRKKTQGNGRREGALSRCAQQCDGRDRLGSIVSRESVEVMCGGLGVAKSSRHGWLAASETAGWARAGSSIEALRAHQTKGPHPKSKPASTAFFLYSPTVYPEPFFLPRRPRLRLFCIAFLLPSTCSQTVDNETDAFQRARCRSRPDPKPTGAVPAYLAGPCIHRPCFLQVRTPVTTFPSSPFGTA